MARLSLSSPGWCGWPNALALRSLPHGSKALHDHASSPKRGTTGGHAFGSPWLHRRQGATSYFGRCWTPSLVSLGQRERRILDILIGLSWIRASCASRPRLCVAQLPCRLTERVHERLASRARPIRAGDSRTGIGHQLSFGSKRSRALTDWTETFAAAARMAASAETGYSCGLAGLTAAHPKSKRSINAYAVAVPPPAHSRRGSASGDRDCARTGSLSFRPMCARAWSVYVACI
jgi:hypothetical protein